MKVFTLVVCIAVVLFLSRMYHNGNVRCLSTIDNRMYFVRNRQSLSEKRHAANQLARLRQHIDILVHAVEQTESLCANEGYQNLVNKWPSVEVEELNLNKKGVFAFTVNKGQRIGLCIQGNEFNDMVFVMIHELAHIVTLEIGHPPIFWDNFRTLLEVAIENGVYVYQNYDENSSKYCGHSINSTPLKYK